MHHSLPFFTYSARVDVKQMMKWYSRAHDYINFLLIVLWMEGKGGREKGGSATRSQGREWEWEWVGEREEDGDSNNTVQTCICCICFVMNKNREKTQVLRVMCNICILYIWCESGQNFFFKRTHGSWIAFSKHRLLISALGLLFNCTYDTENSIPFSTCKSLYEWQM